MLVFLIHRTPNVSLYIPKKVDETGVISVEEERDPTGIKSDIYFFSLKIDPQIIYFKMI